MNANKQIMFKKKLKVLTFHVYELYLDK